MKHNVAVVMSAVALGLLAGTAHAAVVRAADGPERAVAATPSPDRTDDMIRRAFNDVLRRDPTRSELRRYRYRIDEDDWTESDIRRDLRSRDDYRSYTSRSDVERIIRRAYQDILDREPDEAGLRMYREAMLDREWNEQAVREDLRKSPEFARQNRRSAERIVRRAYQDILHREPDPGGFTSYVNRILNNDWDEMDVREALRRSPEKEQQREQMSRQRAEEIVRGAYRSVLRRDPDAVGLQGYMERVMRDRLTQSQVEEELRRSPEFREQGRMTREQAEAVVRNAYRAVLHREPDESGMRTFVERVMRDRWSQGQVETELRRSDEFRQMRK